MYEPPLPPYVGRRHGEAKKPGPVEITKALLSNIVQKINRAPTEEQRRQIEQNRQEAILKKAAHEAKQREEQEQLRLMQNAEAARERRALRLRDEEGEADGDHDSVLRMIIRESCRVRVLFFSSGGPPDSSEEVGAAKGSVN